MRDDQVMAIAILVGVTMGFSLWLIPAMVVGFISPQLTAWVRGRR